MPQFAPRPMQPESYRAVARRLRLIADHLDARCEPQTPHDRRALTLAVNTLYHLVRALSRRHHQHLYAGPVDEPGDAR